MIAGIGLKADIPAVGNIKIRTQKGADKRVFQFVVAALCEQGQPYLMRFAAGGIVKNRQASDDTCRFLHILSSPFSAF
mgnify:CR=1 FL=1